MKMVLLFNYAKEEEEEEEEEEDLGL